MIFKPELCIEILCGGKTVTRRPATGQCRYEYGKTYSVQPGMARPTIARIKVTSVRCELLGDITHDEAVREGFGSRSSFLQYWRELYGGRCDLKQPVHRIEFKVVGLTAMICPSCDGTGVDPIPVRDQAEALEHVYARES